MHGAIAGIPLPVQRRQGLKSRPSLTFCPGRAAIRDLRLYALDVARPSFGRTPSPTSRSRDGRIPARPHPPRTARPGRLRSGPVREQRPVYVDLLPPCNNACPAGENIQAWLAHARAGRDEEAWRQLTADNPFAGDPRPGLLPPVRDRLQPRRARRRGLDPRGRALPRRPRHRAGLAVRPAAGPQRPAGARRRLRPVRAVRRLPPGPARATRSSSATAGREPGGMMRYGIPAYRLPRDVLDAEIARIAALGVVFEQDHRVTDLQAERRGASTRSSSRSARTCPSGSTSQRRRRPGRRRRRFLRERRRPGEQRRCPATGRGLRRRQHGHGRRPRRPPARCRRHGHRLPAHPRADARARVGGRRTPRPRASGSTGCARSARWATTT